MDLLARLRAVGLAAAAVSAAALAAPSPSSAASFSDGFGVRPIKRNGDELAPSYFVLKGKPGQTLRETAILSNSAKTPIKFYVDGVDGLTGTTSGSVYANRDDRHLEASRWVRPPKRQMTLAPGSSEKLRFTVKIPDDARPGDHLAGLAFQDLNEETSKSRFSVRQVIRVVMGVQISIDGGSPPQAELGDVKLKALAGTSVPSVTLGLTNKGQLLCKPKVKVTLQPPDGKPPVTAEQQLDTLLPEDQIDYPLAFKGAMPAGTYKANATVDGCGAHQERNVETTLEDPLSGTTPMAGTTPVAVIEKAGTPLWQIALVAFAAGFGGLGIAVLFLRRKPKAAADAPPPADPPADPPTPPTPPAA